MANLNALTNSELRDKLLEYGYDIPSSVNKDFLLKKLKKVIAEKGANVTPTPTTDASASSSRKSATSTRRSVTPGRTTVVGSRRSEPVPVLPPPSVPPVTTRTGRQSLGVDSASASNRPAVRSRRSDIGGGGDRIEEREEPPVRRTTPARTTRASIIPARNVLVATRTPPKRGQYNADFGSYEDDLEEEEVDEPMPQSQGSRSLSWGSPREPEPQLQQIPTRSSLRPPATKRARPSDSPSTATPPLKRTVSTFSQILNSSSYLSSVSSRVLPSQTTINDSNLNSATSSLTKAGFGMIVNGRRMQTDCTPNDTLEPSKFIFKIPEADAVEYVVLFLNEYESFAPGTAGQIYFGWPDERNETKWHELGHISNLRPSAIFNVTDFKQAVSTSTNNQSLFSYGSQNTGRQLTGPTTAQIGISIEPLDVIVSSMSPQAQLL